MKIYLVDDHHLFREGLAFLLSNSDDLFTVFEAINGKDLLMNIQKNIPDIILMDIEMPEMNGIEATREVLKKYADVKIIALSMYGNENYYYEMIEAGAKGFLLKNSKFEDVKRAIVEVLDGNNYFSPEILDAIIKNLNKQKKKDCNELTERETEILYHICKGFSNQEMADLLFISKRTVDKHRENLLLKTQAKNTAGLVMYAIKNKIVEV
ncbi:MAG: response regulator transcription factor [Salinivirgaceae bacterium]|nr:response regulator transcription factor [Salinivirgaceae bacterium]